MREFWIGKSEVYHSSVFFVGGHEIEKVIELFLNFSFSLTRTGRIQVAAIH